MLIASSPGVRQRLRAYHRQLGSLDCRFVPRFFEEMGDDYSRIFAVRLFLFVLCIAALSPCRAAFAQNASAGPEALPAHADAQLSLGPLKGLAGTWTGQVTTDPPDPDINGAIQVTMRVASHGNVVVHEIAPGGVPEPTMIYLED